MKLSIVLPAYNEQENIRHIYNELISHLDSCTDELEILFIDDGSKDNTFEIIREISREDGRVKGYRFSRNFGHQSALLAGLSFSDGDLTVTMDCDGQHPAEVVPELIKESMNGYDIVNTKRLSTKDAGWVKRKTSSGFYKVLNLLSDVKIESDSSDFRLMNKKAKNAFLELDEQSRFTRGLVSWIGFKQSIISFHAPERFAGSTKYTMKKMMRFGIDGITAFSSKPLRISFYFGLFVLLIGIAYSVFALIMYFQAKTIPGWTSLLISIFFIGGVQLLTLGIFGEYLARIFSESKRRPHYFIQDKC